MRKGERAKEMVGPRQRWNEAREREEEMVIAICWWVTETMASRLVGVWGPPPIDPTPSFSLLSLRVYPPSSPSRLTLLNLFGSSPTVRRSG
jgi:hypothetical protein